VGGSGAEAVEDRMEAELEGVFGDRAVFGRCRFEASSEPWKARCDLAGLRSRAVVQASIGEPLPSTMVLGIAAPTVYTLWLLAMGIVLIRRPAD
jgi:hypothetical protein